MAYGLTWPKLAERLAGKHLVLWSKMVPIGTVQGAGDSGHQRGGRQQLRLVVQGVAEDEREEGE